ILLLPGEGFCFSGPCGGRGAQPAPGTRGRVQRPEANPQRSGLYENQSEPCLRRIDEQPPGRNQGLNPLGEKSMPPALPRERAVIPAKAGIHFATLRKCVSML